MSTNSGSQFLDEPASDRIPDVVCRSLKTALAVQCRRRHDADVTVRRLERTAADQPMRIRITYSDQIEMTARIRVVPVGGNVYDIHSTVEEGPSRRFTYSLPGQGGTALSRAPCLGRKLGTFLLKQLEQRVGHHHLRQS